MPLSEPADSVTAMDLVALVGLLDSDGWLLLQERDEHATVDPNKWSLVGGGVEPGETSAAAAQRELVEETGIACDHLVPLGSHVLPCVVHGEDHVDLFTARMPITDADVDCREGRRIVFVEPNAIGDLDLTDMTRALFQTVLSSRPA
jgi:8-oxo-dGTP pyrophosphatase MutT (NUDIX family)